MPSIADSIALRSTIKPALAFAAAALLGVASAPALAQASGSTPPPAPATYTGCVQKAPDSTLVISTPTACARLTGKAAADSQALAGHQIELKGILTSRTPNAAASIQVDSVLSIGKSCSDICSLNPPGTRGLHRPAGSAVPGSEGGTPGVAPPPPQ
jgi:hypothetical protein